MAMKTNEFKMGGYLISKSVSMGKDKNNKEFMTVDLELQVGENQRATLNVFSYKLKANGEPNKIYQSLETIKNTYLSLNSQVTNRIANKEAKPVKHEATTVSKIEECDFIFANKDIKLAMNYYMKEGELQSNFKLSTNFVNRAKATDDKTPYIEGNLYGVITKDATLKEFDDKREISVEIAVPEFRKGYTKQNGDTVEDKIVIEKFDLVLKDNEDAVDYCMEIFRENAVVCVGVEPTLKVEKEEKKEETVKRGFGKISTFEPSTKYVKEIRIMGAYDLEQYEYENDESFNFDLYADGLNDFDIKMEELKNGGNSLTIQKGFGKKKDNDLPF